MNSRLTEETVLFISVFKWIIISSVVGAIVGLSTTGFLKALNWSAESASQYPYYFLLLPAGLFLSALITKLAPDAQGHGTEKVIEAVHKHSGKIKAGVVPVKLITTIITLTSGGSVGKEGPCAQIGGGLSSIIADIFRLDDNDRKKLVICGISAGFASVFGTPIAGAIFGVEVLFVGSILYEVLLPSFISGVTAYQVSSSLGIYYFNYDIRFAPVFSEVFVIRVVIAGVFLGLCSFLLIETMHYIKNMSDKIKIWMPLKAFIGGLILIGLSFIFSTKYLGLGLDTIESCLDGNQVIWYAFIAKMVFTAITLSFGGSGGIVTPIFFIGTTAGALYAQIAGLDIATFSCIGFVALLSGAANTPIAASIMAVELFGPKIGPYAAVACVISFIITGHRSVYPSQVLSIQKSASFDVDLGKEMEGIEPHFHQRKKSLISAGFKIARTLKDKKAKKDNHK